MNFSKTWLCWITAVVLLQSLTYAQSRIVDLQGLSTDSTIKWTRIVNYPPLWLYKFSSITSLSEQKLVDDTVELKFSIDKPADLTMMLLGKNVHLYATPGDKVHFMISRINNDPVVTFTGKNAAQYNYPSRSDQFVLSKLGLKFPPRFSAKKGLNDYQPIIEQWYNYRVAFFEKYIKENAVSTDFISYYRNEIKFEYIQLIYSPFLDSYFHSADLPRNYLTKSNQFLEKIPSFSHVSRNILLALTFKYIYSYSDHIWDSFDDIYRSVNERFSGITRTYLLTNLIGIYSKKQLPGYRTSLLDAIGKAKHSIRDTICLKYISQCELDYLLVDQPFSQDVLDHSYFRIFQSNDVISFRKLLELYKDQPLYIDFWASWCAACREDIANSTVAKQFLASANVAYINISIDKPADMNQWQNAAVVDRTTNNQYLLVDGVKSPLGQFLKLTSIPRYIIVNSEHQLKNYDAPRPIVNQLSNLKNTVSATSINSKIGTTR